MGNAVEEGPDVDVQHPVLLPTAPTSNGQCVMGTAPRTIAIAVMVKDRLKLLFQQHRCCGLGDAVHRVRHPQYPDPGPVVLRYLHRPHRPREVAPRTHPVPQLVEVVPLVVCKAFDADGVHARRTAVRLDLHPRLENEALVDVKRLHSQRWSVHQLLPRRVDRWMIWPARPLRSSPITGPSSLLRAGPPLCLASVLSPMQPWPPGVLPLGDQGANITHFDWPFVSRRQVLLFHASACNELTPPLHRAPPGPHTGSSLAEGGAASPAFVPGSECSPGFDAVTKYFDASAVVYTCSSSRRSPDPLIAGLFPSRFPPRLLTGMTLRRL